MIRKTHKTEHIGLWMRCGKYMTPQMLHSPRWRDTICKACLNRKRKYTRRKA